MHTGAHYKIIIKFEREIYGIILNIYSICIWNET